MTDGDIRQLFHASLLWVDVTTQDAVDVGWMFDGVTFQPPGEVPNVVPSSVTLEELQRQLALISGQLAVLASK